MRRKEKYIFKRIQFVYHSKCILRFQRDKGRCSNKNAKRHVGTLMYPIYVCFSFFVFSLVPSRYSLCH